MHRRHVLALLGAAPFAASGAFALNIIAPLTFDAQGRPMTEVLLNGRPFTLVLDTGAGATVLSPATIEALALQPSGQRVRVQGASGAEEVALYSLARVQLGALERANMTVAPLPNNPSTEGHAGVLGAAVFLGARVQFDIENNAFRADTGAGRAPLQGGNIVQVEFRNRTFAHFPVTVNGAACSAVLDTGARRSVGNMALRDALGFAANDPRLHAVEAIGGATSHTTDTQATDIESIAVAGHDFGAIELAFADLPVFRMLQADGAPKVILGVDVLRRARSITLDYDSGQLQLIV